MRTGIELLVEAAEVIRLTKSMVCICEDLVDTGEMCWPCMVREDIEEYLDVARPEWRAELEPKAATTEAP